MKGTDGYDLLVDYPNYWMYTETEAGGIWPTGDPFGLYLRDGVAALWVWCDLDTTGTPPERTNVVESFGWYCYGDGKTGSNATVPWTVTAMADLIRRGYDIDVCVGTRIVLGGKTMEDIEVECRRILAVFKGPHIRKARRVGR